MRFTRTLGLLAGLAMLGSFAGTALAQANVETVVTNVFEPYAVAIGPDGTTYISDSANHRILKLAPGTTMGSVLAGQTGIAGSNDGVGDAALFSQPQGLVVARGGLIVADSGNHTLRFVNFNGVVSTVAGAPGVIGNVNGTGADARFRYPAGLAVDSADNVYVADLQNNSIRKLDSGNNVTTVLSGLFQPAGVAVGPNGELWIPDTRRHCIKRLDTNGVVTVIAGVSGVSGTADSTVATSAYFTSPRSVLWLGGNSGFLVSDSGNHAIRRIYYNTNFAGWSVETFAGTKGVYGLVNGPALSAQFNNPVSIIRDDIGGGFLVADKGNNQIRRINTGAVQPPVADPVIGWVELRKDAFGAYVTHLNPVIQSTFNNDVVIAIKGEPATATYYTLGATPPNQFEDTIPVPSPGVGMNPPPYRDGAPPSDMPPTLTEPQPDLTIKAVGTQDGRRSSRVVQARFQFKTGNPVINGDNGASFTLENVTDGAEMWYTIDGSEPTNNPSVNPNVIGPRVAGDIVSFRVVESNVVFKVRAYKANYKPSDVITKEFKPNDFVANRISFGFQNGEASSDFVAAAGQRFYAPITLSLLDAQQIYSFQFNVVVTNLNGLPVDGSQAAFNSSLRKPLEGVTPPVYVPIPPAMFRWDGSDYVQEDLVFTNPAVNLLGVGWLERWPNKLLYDSTKQDLVTFSQAHNTMFAGSAGKVVLGGYSFVVPAGSPDGSTYQIRLGRASGTSDGVDKDVYIDIPTNGAVAAGSINGIKTVTVGSRRYVVGDCMPFRWYNAGDFGETNLLNNDVMQIFQAAAYFHNMPPEGSDFFDAMDSSDGTSNLRLDGTDTLIDSVQFGDGVLNVDDIFVTFRRSLDPSLKWYARYWENGARKVVEVPNRAPAETAGASLAKKASATTSAKAVTPRTGTASMSLVAGDVVAAAGSVAEVPIRVHVRGGLPVRVAMLSVTVQPLDGSPALTGTISLNASLGSPTLGTTSGSGSISAAWLDASVAGLSEDALFGTLSLPLPASASAGSAYRVHIDHFSGSPNGVGLIRATAYDGIVTCSDRSSSTAGDSISDLWRLRWFGTLNDPRSAATADPDHDGRNNLLEFQAGTNPLNSSSLLTLATQPRQNGIQLTFPTGLGRSYILERSSTLIGPWAPVSTNAGDGTWREVTEVPAGNGMQFYRVRTQ